jgi:hypothetical protein
MDAMLLVAIATLQLGMLGGLAKFWGHLDDKFASLEHSIAKVELVQSTNAVQFEAEIKLLKAELFGLQQNTDHKLARVFREIEYLKQNAGMKA